MKTNSRIFRNKLILAISLLTAVLLIWGAGPVLAADPWPVKQVEIINPFAAGAAADIQGPETRGDHLPRSGTADGGPQCPGRRRVYRLQ